jgi:hypothetical protein
MALALRKPTPVPHLRLIYSRPDGDFAVHDELVAGLRGPDLHFEVCPPRTAAQLVRIWVSATQPTVLLLRGAEVVAIAVGRFPRRELERLIDSAR